MRKLLVCDLDGTLLGEPASLSTLLQRLREPQAPVLAFATGRQGFSARALLCEWDVRQGAYLIAGVGTEIYRRIGNRWMAIAAWPELTSPWDARRASRALSGLEDLRPQEIAAASAYKLSYFASPSLVPHVVRTLREAGVEATVVHSHGNMLDVLPAGIDKGGAVAWLARRLGLPFERVVTCGNTVNDLSMLRLPCSSIVVGNADAHLVEAARDLPRTFLARKPCAGGIIEGLHGLGWLYGGAWR